MTGTAYYERLFDEQVRDARELSKAHAKPRCKPRLWLNCYTRGGNAGVTLEEVIQAARSYQTDLNLTLPAARTWVARGLIPAPEVSSQGRGKGTRAHYPDDAAAQMVVAFVMGTQGFKQKEIAQARCVVLEGVPTASDFMQGVTEALILPPENIAHTLATPRAQNLAGAIRFYAMAIAYARALWQFDKPHGLVFEARFDADSEGRETLTFFASLPGCYINPRHTAGAAFKVAELDRTIREGSPEEVEATVKEPYRIVSGEPRRFFEITFAKILPQDKAGRLWDFLHRND